MATQYTPILQLALPVTGELNGTWGDVVNDNITSMVEEAIAGLATISTWTSNSHTLTTADGTTDEARCAMLVATNTTAASEIICPARTKLFVLKNDSSYTVTLKTSAGTGTAVAAGETAFLFCDGTNVEPCVTTIIDGHITGNLVVDGTTTLNDTATTETILPAADNTYDLGSGAASWRNLYIDGTATIASLVATTADINGGTVDNATIGATTASTGRFTQVNITGQGDLRLEDTTGGEYVALQAPGTLAASYTLTMPADDGTNGQALITDGSGNLSWSTAASGDVYGPASATDNAVSRFDGTTGKLIQNSGVIIDDSNNVTGVANFTNTGNTTLGNASTDTVTVNGYMGVGGAGSSDSGVVIYSSALTGANQYGIFSAPIGNSSATAAIVGFGTNARTANATFTVTDAIAFKALNAVKGAGSTITNQHGLYIADQTQGTYNSGITSAVSSGTNKWNIYASGTAQNYFAGNVGIGTSSPAATLNVVAAAGEGLPALGGSAAAIFTRNASSGQTGGISIIGGSAGASFVNFGDKDSESIGRIEYNHINNYFALNTNSTERMRIDSSGNVGIGTSSPQARLQVQDSSGSANGTIWLGNATYYGTLKHDASATGAIIYTVASASGGGHIFKRGSTEQMRLDSAGNLGLGVTPSAWSGAVPAIDIGGYGAVGQNSGGGGGYALYGNAYEYTSNAWKYKQSYYATMYRTYAGQHMWYTAPSGTAGNAISFTQAMTLDASGNLGIGTSSPTTQLSIYQGGNGNNLNVLSRTYLGGTYSSNSLVLGYSVKADTTANDRMVGTETNSGGGAPAAILMNSGTIQFHTASSITSGAAFSSERMRIDSSGNVGIGNTSPGCKLGVTGVISALDTGSAYDSQPLDSGYGLCFQADSSGITHIDSYSVGGGTGIAFGTNSGGGAVAERMRIDSSGSVCINKTAPTWFEKLSVSPSSTNTEAIGAYSSSSAYTGRLVSLQTETGGGTTWQLINGRRNGGVDVFVVYGNGSVTNSTGSYGTISDAKLKENIVDATPKLNDVMNLKVRNFNLKDEPSEKQIGFVAQEIETVFPSLVEAIDDKDDDGVFLGTVTKQVKTTVLIPILVKAIQELKAELDATKAEVAALKAK